MDCDERGSQGMTKLLQPYVSARRKNQLVAVVPLAAYLALFLVLVLRQLVADALIIGPLPVHLQAAIIA